MDQYLLRNDTPMHKSMIAVLERNNLGSRDGYGRGIWVNYSTCNLMADIIQASPNGYVECHEKEIHVFPEDFRRLYQGG